MQARLSLLLKSQNSLLLEDDTGLLSHTAYFPRISTSIFPIYLAIWSIHMKTPQRQLLDRQVYISYKIP